MNIRNVEINEKGSALVIAIFFIMILTVIGLSLMLNTSVDNVISNNYSKTVRATYTATSGIERFKAYLLYDYKHDPKGWGNRYLVVPLGSTYLDGTVAPSAAAIGASGSDAYFDLCPSPCSDPTAVPNKVPYKINPNIPYVVQTASQNGLLFPEVPSSSTNPIVTPGSGYQLMLRNVPSTIGGDCGGTVDCDAASIYLISIGTTTTTKAYLNAQSKGMNVIEHGAMGSDISVWNNIFFFGDNALTGGGAMTIHGNVHALGPDSPANASSTTFATRADVLNSYYVSKGGSNFILSSPLRDALSTPQQRNPNNLLDPVNNLGAAVRCRNGLIDISQGNAIIGQASGTGMPFKIVATCHKCGTNNNGFTEANPAVYATKKVNYDVPTNLQSLIKVPSLSDPYQDPATNITYPDYTAYFIGRHTGTTEYPGVLGLKLANALGNDNVTCFDTSRSPCNSAANQLATVLWSDVAPYYVRRNIFAQNMYDSTVPTQSQEQQPPDPIDPTSEPDPLFSPIIGSGGGSGNAGGKTFMIVATDATQGVAIVYKEVAPFLRDVAGTSNVSVPRLVHGFVYAPPGADMGALRLKVDVDGADIDHDGHDWIWDSTVTCPVGETACHAFDLSVANSNRLVRKVTNALWRAGRGECGYLGPCYEAVRDDVWEDSMTYGSPSTSRIYDTTTPSPYYLKVAATSPENVNGKLIAFGAIETTDTVYFGNFTYAGRFTMYARDSNGGGTGVGRINYNDNSYPISSYQWPVASNPATYIAFPCQNNMGVMTSNDIDHSISPHDNFGGAYYAEGTIHLTRQEQILGAMVANAWAFQNGGNPDFFQAMEISHCLPPYIIAKDPIVFVGSQSWTER